MVRKNERMRKMEYAIQLIQKRWGSQAIHKASQAPITNECPVIPTGFRNVDEALAIGGFPRGRMSELIASGTAGQATLLAKTLRQAQYTGQQAVYVDVDHAIDLDFMSRCGVALDSLIILRPLGFCHALQMTGDLIREGGADLLVFDRVHPSLASTDVAGMDQALREWNLMLQRSLSTILFLTETVSIDWYPAGLALPFFTSVRLSFEQQEWLRHRRRVSGFVSRVTVLKNKLGSSGQTVLIKIMFSNHIHGDEDE